MNESLQFELPNRKDKAQNRQPKFLITLMIITLIAVVANTAIVLTQPKAISGKISETALSADLQKKLALKLEKQGLNTVAAEAWKEYLYTASLDEKETAMIWYRIGKLYQDDTSCENALDSYYRSESYEKVDFISAEIARRIQECLESMGKFSALRHELSERVDMDSSGDKIVAEIGPRKISTSELDRQIEMKIDQQLAMFASYLSDTDRNKQKEDMLKQFSTSSQRMMFLNQYILEEILYRKAREIKLADNPDVRDMLRDQERSLLAKKVIEKEFADQIHITPGDLTTYYEANKSKYVHKERQQPFEEAKTEVFKALRSQKEGEIQQHLLSQLKEQYDVVIHRSAFVKEQAEETDKSDAVKKGSK